MITSKRPLAAYGKLQGMINLHSHPIKRVAMLGAVIGIVVAAGISAAAIFFGYMMGPEAAVFWPTGIILMGLESNRSIATAVAVWTIAALGNAILYSVIAVCFTVAGRFISKILFRGPR
jgi:hypothetical protein